MISKKFFALLFFASMGFAASPDSPYGSDKPLTEPTIFAQGDICTGDHESHPAFTPAGNIIYFLKNAPDFSFWTIVVSMYREGKWTTPEVADFSGQYADADPFITPDGNRLYFISNRPVNDKQKEDLDIWVVERKGGGWAQPERLPEPVNSPGNEWHPTLASDGTLYFGSDREGGKGRTDLYRCRYSDGKYQAAENLGEPVNTQHDEFEPFIAGDQSFLIFMARRPDALGAFDLYVTYQEAGKWTAPRNLGDKINSAGFEYSPKISPDGKYFFWTSTRGFGNQLLPKPLQYNELIQKLRSPGNGLGDIYFMDLSATGIVRK